MMVSSSECCSRAFFFLVIVLSLGCNQHGSEWRPGDQELIRELVSEIGDARSHPDQLVLLFMPAAVPDQAWLQASKDLSFVVTEIVAEGDAATVEIDLENHFGEIQRNLQWKCLRTEEGWRIASAPLNEASGEN